jgi:hypothetical protein
VLRAASGARGRRAWCSSSTHTWGTWMPPGCVAGGCWLVLLLPAADGGGGALIVGVLRCRGLRRRGQADLDVSGGGQCGRCHGAANGS